MEMLKQLAEKFKCDVKGKPKAPGIFHSFVAQRIEKIITKEQAEDEELMESLKKRGITPVTVEGGS